MMSDQLMRKSKWWSKKDVKLTAVLAVIITVIVGFVGTWFHTYFMPDPASESMAEVIKLIRASNTPEEARLGLMEKFGLSDIQARAILDMTLRRLTGLERDKIKEEYAELMKTIEYLKSILADEGLRMQIIKDELGEMLDKYGDERRTTIIHSAEDMSMAVDVCTDRQSVSACLRTRKTLFKRQCGI